METVRTGFVYKYTFPNDMVYIGRSFNDEIAQRAKNGSAYRGIMKEMFEKIGIENVKVEILHKKLDYHTMVQKELELIEEIEANGQRTYNREIPGINGEMPRFDHLNRVINLNLINGFGFFAIDGGLYCINDLVPIETSIEWLIQREFKELRAFHTQWSDEYRFNWLDYYFNDITNITRLQVKLGEVKDSDLNRLYDLNKLSHIELTMLYKEMILIKYQAQVDMLKAIKEDIENHRILDSTFAKKHVIDSPLEPIGARMNEWSKIKMDRSQIMTLINDDNLEYVKNQIVIDEALIARYKEELTEENIEQKRFWRKYIKRLPSDDGEKAQIVQLYKEGVDVAVLSKHFLIAEDTINKLLRDKGVKKAKRGKVLSDDEIKEIIELYQTDEYTIKTLGLQFGCSGSKISKVLKDNNIPLKPNNPKITEDEEKAIVAKYQERELGVSKVAELFHRDKKTIQRVLKRHNVEMNKPSVLPSKTSK